MSASENREMPTLRPWRWQQGQRMGAAGVQTVRGCRAAAQAAHARSAAFTGSAHRACKKGATQGCARAHAQGKNSRLSLQPSVPRAGLWPTPSTSTLTHGTAHADASPCCYSTAAHSCRHLSLSDAAERACPSSSQLLAGLPCCGSSAGGFLRRPSSSSTSPTSERCDRSASNHVLDSMPTALVHVPTVTCALAVLTHVIGALRAGAEASAGALEPSIGGHRQRWGHVESARAHA